MTSGIQTALATAAALSFFMTSASFVALVWRVSWGVRGFIEAERERAQTEQEIARMLGGFIQAQRETNDQVWTAIQVQSARMNGLVGKSRARECVPGTGG